MPTVIQDRAQALLASVAGDGASFRRGQRDAITALVADRRRVLLVQRTGWGKSAVYFIATRLLRDAGAGPTLLISPLLALMRNQIDMAARAGVRAATINSANRGTWTDVESALANDAVDLLLVSPERLNNPDFRRQLGALVAPRAGLLVIDEVHCISDWGHDFRPDYRRVARVLDALPRGVPVLCATATANDRVVADVQNQLGHNLLTLRGSLDRESLVLSALDLPAQADRLAWLAQQLPGLPGSGIVYCLTIADTHRVASWLQRRGVDAAAYSGDTDPADREDLERRLLANELKVLVATSALGMGFDKPDLGFVIHYQSPGSPIAYYQQVGRAGRALATAQGVLLTGREDADIQDYFIRTAFPPREQAEQVVALLDAAHRPSSLSEIERQVNARRSRLEAMLKILEVEGAVQRDGGKWLRTLKPWRFDADRVERVTAVRRQEQAAMRTYARTSECLMAFLRQQLDDNDGGACGRCVNCTGRRPPSDLPRALVADALEHLRTQALTVQPRKQWPAGTNAPAASRIAAELQLLSGRALSVYGDGGWGALVRDGRTGQGRFADELVEAAAQLVSDRWRPQPPPRWITYVPSASRPGLVADLAQRLGQRLGLPVHDTVNKVRQNRPQKDMRNSAQQLTNVSGAFRISGEVPDTPVLLVDDLVDSGWTLTVVGVALRQAGSGPVHPLALASATGL